MTTLESPRSTLEDISVSLPMVLELSGGLRPFLCERYELSAVEDAPPFLRLTAVEEDLAFHLVDPFLVLPDYRPEISDTEDQLLDIQRPEETLVLSIVNLSEGHEKATVNLAAPIVVNIRTGRGKQVILANASEFGVRHQLPTG